VPLPSATPPRQEPDDRGPDSHEQTDRPELGEEAAEIGGTTPILGDRMVAASSRPWQACLHLKTPAAPCILIFFLAVQARKPRSDE
jgi:hypothetical protein